MNFIRKYIKRIAFCFTVFILIILIGLTYAGRMDNGTAAGSVVSGFQKITYSVGQTFSNALYSVQNFTKTREENIVLKETVQELRQELRRLETIVNNSDALKSEYELKKTIEHDYVIGQVIALDDSNWFSRFTIDKGELDGLSVNDIVVEAFEGEDGLVQQGLVGIITAVGPNWARAVTLLDDTCKLSFKDISNVECGIMEGSVEEIVTGYFFNSKAEANVGDDLVTSGIGEVYLPDIYIGKVSEVVDTTDASVQRIVVEPAVDFSKLYRVFVLKIDR